MNEVSKLALELSLMEKDCPAEYYSLYHVKHILVSGGKESIVDPPECPVCHGTGKVPLFDVREKCELCWGTGVDVYACNNCANWHTDIETEPLGVCPGCRTGSFIKVSCLSCDGRGWNATEDMERWFIAVRQAFEQAVAMLIVSRFNVLLMTGEHPTLALLRAIKEAVSVS